MTEGAWRDRAGCPAADGMAECLDDGARLAWAELTSWLRDAYGVDGEPVWGGTDAGWVMRYRRAGRALVTLSPLADGTFESLVVLGPSTWPAFEALDVGPAARAAFLVATPYADGRWVRVHVRGMADAGDVRRLVALKAPPRRVRRQVASGA